MGLEEDALNVAEEMRAKIPTFPSNCCKLAVIALHGRGYRIVRGRVVVDNYCGIGESREISHFWNYDPATGRSFDVTASQFNIHLSRKKTPEILFWVRGQQPTYIEEEVDIKPWHVI